MSPISTEALQLEAREAQIKAALDALYKAIVPLRARCCEDGAERITRAAQLINQAIAQLEGQ